MAVDIHPIRLYGNWDIGYALDTHVTSSIYIGDDPYGNAHFENTYSPIGALLKKFKYDNRYDNLNEIVSTVLSFFASHPEMSDFETIIPVPPTKNRLYQPTWEIGEAVADKMKKYFRNDILSKESVIESKSLPAEEKKRLRGTISQNHFAKRKNSVLLLDDLYKTGATLTECVNVLKQDRLIDKIYVLTITKTKNQS